MKTSEIMLNGLVRQNPVLRLVLGTCSVLALSQTAVSGLGMGLAVTFVLVFSNLFISALRKLIPAQVRIPAYVMIIATLVTVVKLVMVYFAATVPVIKFIYEKMGVFLPLIVVNCIILGRAEVFASKNNPIASIVDGVSMGLGYTIVLVLISIVREFFAYGTFFNVQVIKDFQIPFFSEPCGAFLVFGLAIALFNAVLNAVERKQQIKIGAQTALNTEA